MRAAELLNFLKESGFDYHRKNRGEVALPASDVKDPHIQQVLKLVANHVGISEEEAVTSLMPHMQFHAEMARRAPILYGTMAKNAPESAAFRALQQSGARVDTAPKFENYYFFEIVHKLQGQITGYFPLQSYIDKSQLANPKFHLFGEEEARTSDLKAALAQQIPTAAATPAGNFYFNKDFMQNLLDFAHLKGIEGPDSKYKSKGGEIPDEYSWIEFLILHEFMHYTNDDFYRQKLSPSKTNGKIMNWVGDFRTNYFLVKSGFEPLPMGLFNDEINGDRQRTYDEMYDLIEDEFNKLSQRDKKWLEGELDENADHHDKGNEEGKKKKIKPKNDKGKKQDPKKKKKQQEQNQEPEEIIVANPGDVVRNRKTNEYGRVERVIGADGQEQIVVRKITQGQAEVIVKGTQGGDIYGQQQEAATQRLFKPFSLLEVVNESATWDMKDCNIVVLPPPAPPDDGDGGGGGPQPPEQPKQNIEPINQPAPPNPDDDGEGGESDGDCEGGACDAGERGEGGESGEGDGSRSADDDRQRAEDQRGGGRGKGDDEKDPDEGDERGGSGSGKGKGDRDDRDPDQDGSGGDGEETTGEISKDGLGDEGDGDGEYETIDMDELEDHIRDTQGKVQKDIEAARSKGDDGGDDSQSSGRGERQAGGQGGSPGTGSKFAGQKRIRQSAVPPFNWQSLMGKFLKSGISKTDETYQKPHRRSVTQMDIARQTGAAAIKPAEVDAEPDQAKLFFILDCSGSMTGVMNTVMNSCRQLLKQPIFKDTAVLVGKFSNASLLYLVNEAQNKAAQIEEIGEQPQDWNTTPGQVFGSAEGGGTTISAELVKQAVDAINKGYNITLFSDMDILHEWNFKHFMTIVKAGVPKGQVFVIFDDLNTYRTFRQKTGITSDNFTAFDLSE